MKLFEAINCCIENEVSVSSFSMLMPTAWMPKELFLGTFKNFSSEFLENGNGYNYYKLTAVLDGTEFLTIVAERAGDNIETV